MVSVPSSYHAPAGELLPGSGRMMVVGSLAFSFAVTPFAKSTRCFSARGTGEGNLTQISATCAQRAS